MTRNWYFYLGNKSRCGIFPLPADKKIQPWKGIFNRTSSFGLHFWTFPLLPLLPTNQNHLQLLTFKGPRFLQNFSTKKDKRTVWCALRIIHAISRIEQCRNGQMQKLCEKGHHIKKCLLLPIYTHTNHLCIQHTHTHTHTNYQFSMSQPTECMCKHVFSVQRIKSANRLLSIQLYDAQVLSNRTKQNRTRSRKKVGFKLYHEIGYPNRQGTSIQHVAAAVVVALLNTIRHLVSI